MQRKGLNTIAVLDILLRVAGLIAFRLMEEDGVEFMSNRRHDVVFLVYDSSKGTEYACSRRYLADYG